MIIIILMVLLNFINLFHHYFYINNHEVIFLYNQIILQILIYHIKEHILQNI